MGQKKLTSKELKQGLLNSFKRGLNPTAGTKVIIAGARSGLALVELGKLDPTEREELKNGLTSIFRSGQNPNAGTAIIEAGSIAGLALVRLDRR